MGVGVWLHLFLTLHLVELSSQCFSCFTPGIEAKYPRRHLGPRVSVDALARL